MIDTYAFPLPDTEHEYMAQPGMTLRDYFAGQVLTGILAATERIDSTKIQASAKDAARISYMVADEMLRARMEAHPEPER